MLSGIGPSDELKKHSIPVLHDLPGVGKHLMDHPVVNGVFELEKGESYMYMIRLRMQDIKRMIPKTIEYLRSGTGVPSSNVRDSLIPLLELAHLCIGRRICGFRSQYGQDPLPCKLLSGRD